MLIAFRFSNFRSFRDEAELTLVASKADKTHMSALISASVASGSVHLVPAAAIYGANAAGKTNVLKALHYLRDAVLFSQNTWRPKRGTKLAQFARSEDEKTSKFEIDLIISGSRYKYGVIASTICFLEEWLFAYPRGRERLIFRRIASEKQAANHGPDEIRLKIGDTLSPEERQSMLAIGRRTRDNSLFLSAAAQENQTDCTLISAWFDKSLRLFEIEHENENDQIHMRVTASMISDNVSFKTVILPMLKMSDPSVEDIEISSHLIGDATTSDDDEEDITRRRYDITFIHRDRSGIFRLPFASQSRGVQRMFVMAARIHFALTMGLTIVIDEIEASMHPHLARLIVDLFQSKDTNSGGQLIFTTHDTNLLDQSLLRRDQIWFVEKNECCSELYSLLDFNPRKDENLRNGYLRGRYGAIPALGNMEDLLVTRAVHEPQ